MQSLKVISVNIWMIIASLCNLLLLTWIVKKFLYKPVKKILDTRRAAIDADYEQAAAARAKRSASAPARGRASRSTQPSLRSIASAAKA